MNRQTFTDWGGGYDPQGGETTAIFGPAPNFRDAKDRRLAAWGATPESQYPSGYLGTMESTRRSDKIVNAVARTNTRSYTRGVHKGERINPGDYLWPDEFNPMTGLQNQSVGRKFAPTGFTPTHLVNDGKAGPRGIPSNLDRPHQEIIDEQRRSMLKTLAPGWK